MKKMKETPSKDKILKSIELAGASMQQDAASPGRADGTCAAVPANELDDDLPVLFAQRFTQAGGSIFYCANIEELRAQLRDLLASENITALPCSTSQLTAFINSLSDPAARVIPEAHTVTINESATACALPCQALLAADGSTIVTDYQGLGSSLTVVPRTVILIAFTSQVTTTWNAVTQALGEQYDTMPNYIYALTPDPSHKLYMLMIEDRA